MKVSDRVKKILRKQRHDSSTGIPGEVESRVTVKFDHTPSVHEMEEMRVRIEESVGAMPRVVWVNVGRIA